MPMKKLLFTILMFCATLFCCALNDNYGGQDIVLVKNGGWDKGNTRSGECIIATYNNSVLTIGFNVSLGQTEIVLENESGGMVYNSLVNIVGQEHVYVPIANLPSGTYYITIICDRGSAEGEFRIIEE